MKNALPYIPPEHHQILSPEFLEELCTTGRIYGYCYQPTGAIKGKPLDEYRGIPEARGLQVVIHNNPNFDVTHYPSELVTYGETGQIFQNWMQYPLVKKYLEIMREDQTLVVNSGFPVWFFLSNRIATRAISVKGLLIGQ